jgi:hypothetical protein
MRFNVHQAFNRDKESLKMKRILMATTAAAVIGAFALTGTTGFADPGYGGSRGMNMGMMGHDMSSGMMKGHGLSMIGPGGFDMVLAGAIKDRLGIGESQESEWQAYIDALRDNAETMRSMHENINAVHDPQVSGENRVALMDGMHESGSEAFEEIDQARDALFGVLSEEQKTDAQRLLPGAMMGPGPMMSRQSMMMGPCDGSGGSGDPSKT